MSHFTSNLNIDREFHVPPDCLREGNVTCRVVFSDCDVIDRWDDLLTFRVKLFLRITIRSGELVCSFDREIVLKETVWLCRDACVLDCEVRAAGCRCVVNRGRVWCSLAVGVRFAFRKPEPFCPCPVDPCPIHPCPPDPWDCGGSQRSCAPCEPDPCDPCNFRCVPGHCDPCRTRFSTCKPRRPRHCHRCL